MLAFLKRFPTEAGEKWYKALQQMSTQGEAGIVEEVNIFFFGKQVVEGCKKPLQDGELYFFSKGKIVTANIISSDDFLENEHASPGLRDQYGKLMVVIKSDKSNCQETVSNAERCGEIEKALRQLPCMLVHRRHPPLQEEKEALVDWLGLGEAFPATAKHFGLVKHESHMSLIDSRGTLVFTGDDTILRAWLEDAFLVNFTPATHETVPDEDDKALLDSTFGLKMVAALNSGDLNETDAHGLRISGDTYYLYDYEDGIVGQLGAEQGYAQGHPGSLGPFRSGDACHPTLLSADCRRHSAIRLDLQFGHGDEWQA